LTSDSEAGHRQ